MDARTNDPSSDALRERLRRAGFPVARVPSVVIDVAGDPPLGQSQEAIAREEPERLVRALGAAMVAVKAKRGAIAVRTREAEAAVLGALGRITDERAAAARVERVAAVFPTVGIERDLGLAGALVLDGERALDCEAAAFGGARPPRRVTVAGEVASPRVVFGPITVEEAVARAGGAEPRAWVALDGGALGGRLADREEAVRSSLLVVLPSSHPLVARARVSLSDWLRRAASACEGCRACSDLCPPALVGAKLRPHEVIATLVSGRDDGVRLAAAACCTGCAVCDSACPSAISPSALVVAVRDRLPPGVGPSACGPEHPERAARRTGVALLARRLGLGL